jgi:hypothetical protein
VNNITQLIQTAAWKSTPNNEKTLQDALNLPLHIRELIHEKRRARRRWQDRRNPLDKKELNKLTHNLRSAITQAKNETFKTYITNLSPGDHSLWKATKKFKRLTIAIPPIRKQDGSWARTVFTPNNNKDNNNEDDAETFLNASCQLSLPIRAFTPTEVHNIINVLNPHKAPGYNIITGPLLKNLPRNTIVLLTTIYNSMLRLCYFPCTSVFLDIQQAFGKVWHKGLLYKKEPVWSDVSYYEIVLERTLLSSQNR